VGNRGFEAGSILAKHDVDLQAVATTQRSKPEDPVLQKLRRDVVSDYETGVKTLLGDDGYREYKEFERFSRIPPDVGYRDPPHRPGHDNVSRDEEQPKPTFRRHSSVPF
jgi:hypothetical protein